MARSSWITLALVALLAGSSSATPRPKLLLQNGHARPVVSVAFGGRGDVVATGSQDQTARLWDLHGKVLGVFAGHLAGMNRGGVDVALSPDEKTLATGGQDGFVKLWDVATGKVRATVKVGDNYSGAIVRFSPDGRTLAVSERDVELIDVASGRVEKTLAKNFQALDLAFSRDGRRLAAFDSNADVKVWRLRDGTQTASMHVSYYVGHGCVAFLPDGDLLTASSVLDLWKGSHRVKQAQMDGPQLAIAVSPDGKTIAVVHNGVDLCDATTLKVVGKIDAPQANGVAFNPSGKMLAISQDNDRATLWSVGSHPKQVADLVGHSRPIYDLALHGHSLFSVDSHGFATRWDLLSGRAEPVGHGSTHMVGSVAISRTGRWLAVGHRNGALEVIDTTTHKVAWKSQLPGRGYNLDLDSLAFSPDGKLLAGGNGSGVIGLWRIPSGRLLTWKRALDSDVLALCFEGDGRTLAASGALGQRPALLEFDVDRGRLLKLATHRGYNRNYAECLAYTAHGRKLLAGTVYGNLGVYPAATDGEMLGPQPHGETTASGYSYTITEPRDNHDLTALAPSPDGHTVAAGDVNGNIEIFDLATGKQQRVFPGHRGAILSVGWIDQHTLVTAGVDTSVKFWHIPKRPPHGPGKLLATAVSLNNGQDWTVTAPDGRFDGSPGGQRLIAWRIGDKVYQLEQFFNNLFSPGLLEQQLRLKHGVAPPPAITNLQVPPQVHILSPEIGDRFKTPACSVRLKVKNEGGGIGQTALYLNGHRIPPGRAVIRGAVVTYKIDLVPGNNLLRAAAFNKDGSIESHADEVQVMGPAPGRVKPRLWVLAVGIDKYESGLSLGFADADAKSIAGIFKPGLFSRVSPVLLTDKHASKAAILAAFKRLAAESRPQDTVLIYLAGHGTLIDDVFYYLPWDARVGTDDDIRNTCVSSVMLGSALVNIPATKQVLVLDACHSGGSTGALVKMLASRDAVDMVRAQQRLARASGTFLISAATARGYAEEFRQLGHGVLTYAILRGLGAYGKPAATVNSDGEVTMNSLLHYLSDEVPALAEKYHGGRQNVVQFSTGQDFPLLVERH